MADGTKIEWATATWNPITGCTPISEGCEHCYAQRMANRLAGRFGYPADDPFCPGTYHPARIHEPERWKKPRKVFVCSMGDMFNDDVREEDLDRVFDMMQTVSHHTYMILTKRPDNVLPKWIGMVECPWGSLPENVWLGVTAENQARADERIPKLLEIPVAVRFVSVEPMLGPIDLSAYMGRAFDGGGTEKEYQYNAGISWVICGGETGAGARPMDLAWARSLRDQCQDAGVPFFFKRVGGSYSTGRYARETPPDLRVREWPKEAGNG